MKKKEKKMIAILILVSIIIITALWFFIKRQEKSQEEQTVVSNVEEKKEEENKVAEEFVQVLEDGTKLNTSSKLNEIKNFDGLEFGDIQFTCKDNFTVLLATVKNNTGAARDLTSIDVILYDKSGQEMVTLGGLIAPMGVGDTSQFTLSSTLDYANAYDFTIKVKNN